MTVHFTQDHIDLAVHFKQLGLPWEPAVGNYVYDAAHEVQPSSPFQDRVYFLLNYDCFMRKVGGVERFKQIMTWLPTWSDAREILKSLEVGNAEVQQELIRTDALRCECELLVLYELIADRLTTAFKSASRSSEGANS